MTTEGAPPKPRDDRERLRLRALRKLPLRRSLRVTVLLVVVAVLIVPQAFVYAWLGVERTFAARMQQNAAFSANDAARAVGDARSPLDPAVEQQLEAIARTHFVRLRLLDAKGGTLLDIDHDQGTDLSQRIGDLFLGAAEAMTLDAFDETLGPMSMRPEFLESSRAPVNGCRSSPESALLVCHAVRISGHGAMAASSTSSSLGVDDAGNRAGARPDALFVYVQDSSRRPMAHLAYLRYQLPRLMLGTLPFALLLAWWMGRRVVLPIEDLRRQALDKVGEGNPTANLAIRGGDEMQDLAAAFNALLSALEERRGANEAFVADLVHEFKNPVATIRACAEALGESSADEARAARLSRLLKESGVRLDTLVSQFLELARAEAGMVQEPRSAVDLATLARGIIGAMADGPRFAGVRFTVDAPASAEVVGVSYRFESVLRNLLENAASFSGEGGEVRAEVTATEEVVVLKVSDTGPGIALEDLPKVFTRFYTTRGREQGSGLGLALTRAIIEAHGGTVSVRSNPGRGATFVVELPRAPSLVS